MGFLSTCFGERIIKTDILVTNRPFQLPWDIKAALEDKQSTKEVQESLKMTPSTNTLELLGIGLNQGRFKAFFAGNVSFLFQNCAKEHVKHPFKFVFSTVRLKLKCKFVIRGVNSQHLFLCFRYFFTFVQVYQQSVLVNRSKTTLKTISTSL